MTALADKLSACATKDEVAKFAPHVASGVADFTKSINLPIGKMALAEVVRLSFSISECSDASAAGFSALLTGNPATGVVDVFVTTGRPDDFSDDGLAPFQFATNKVSATEVVAVLIVNGGFFSGDGCDSSAWTIGATSNGGTLGAFDGQATDPSSFDSQKTRLHLTADIVAVDREIADTVFPRLKDTEDAAQTAQTAADANSGAIATQTEMIAANKDSVHLLSDDIELIQVHAFIINPPLTGTN